MIALKPCPCGEIPTRLLVQRYDVEGELPVYQVVGNCCGKWIIEKRSDTVSPNLRLRGWWNSAPRPKS